MSPLYCYRVFNPLGPVGRFFNHHFFGRRYDNMPKNGLKTAKIKKNKITFTLTTLKVVGVKVP